MPDLASPGSAHLAIPHVLSSSELIEIEGKKCLLVLIQDNAFRKQSMKAVEKAVGEYESLFVESPCGICRSDMDGRLQIANPTLVEMLGYGSARELLSQNLWADIYADDSARARAMNDLRRDNPEVRGIECSWRRADGKLIRVRTSMHVIRNREGVIDRIETIAEEMTQQRAIEQQLRHSQKMEALALLVGGIAHDFNNILTGILGYGQMLLRGVAPEDKQYRRLSAIVDAALQGKVLTSGLMTFSRRESPDYIRFDPNRVVREMVELFRQLLGEKINTCFDPSADEIAIWGDPGQFQQILMNLAVNAHDAMPTGGELRIKTTIQRIGAGTDPEFPEAPPGHYVLLQVQDDGIGMDAETKDRMFDPFFTTKPPGKGTGLGLATFYAIVKQMKGFVSVDSELGRGTCIRVVFPLAKKPGETPLIKQEQMPRGAGSKVLVVEDDSIVRSMLRDLLAQSGYDVVTAADGEHAAALAKSSNFQIDLLISDVVMPNCSGLELADKLSLLCPNLKVLFISGYFEDVALQECVRRGTASVLFKPFSESELAARVRQVLSQAA